jgi:hypothetical protein
MKRSGSRWFIWSAIGILFSTGLAKVFSGLGSAKVLAMMDPIFGVTFRNLMLFGGVAEITVALACIFRGIAARSKLALVAWIATGFLVYRFGLWCMGWQHPCHCMGTLAGAIHLTDREADNIMKGVLAYLLAGSYLALVLQWRTERAAGSPVAGSVSAA